ncbi:MAG: hypothetical protein GX219_00530 [Tissierellia bacterium]|nr:hypothetical protein [Tissierellia bacterium]
MYNILGALNMDEKTKRDLPMFNELEGWLEIFDGVDNDDIKKSRKEYEQIKAGESEARKQFMKLSSEKKESMKEILNLSDRLNNEKGFSDVKALDREKKNLEKINFDLDNVAFEVEQYPKKVRDANFKILEATIHYTYEEIKKRQEDNDEINAEMVEIRDRLMDLYQKRTENDDWNDKTYLFLHSILGSSLIEKIDDADMELVDEDGD